MTIFVVTKDSYINTEKYSQQYKFTQLLQYIALLFGENIK